MSQLLSALNLQKTEGKALQQSIKLINITKVVKCIKAVDNTQRHDFPVIKMMYPFSMWSSRLLVSFASVLLYLHSVGYKAPTYLFVAFSYLLHYHQILITQLQKKKKKITIKNKEQLIHFFGNLITEKEINSISKFIYSFKLGTNEYIHNAVHAAASYIQKMDKLKHKYSKRSTMQK
eukprot:119092_1